MKALKVESTVTTKAKRNTGSTLGGVVALTAVVTLLVAPAAHSAGPWKTSPSDAVKFEEIEGTK
ncbi:MAG: hypothetical protein OEQ18_16135, partial [Gammaproteobacteria bacterium]|nr:hypothetical protein [Gammaproteobacteria bacterium]